MPAFAAPFPVAIPSPDTPSWLGGACLPDLLPGEAEVARIEIGTARRDVVSVRARRRAGRVHYRVVDECGSAFDFAPRTCARPLDRAGLATLVASIRVRGAERTLLHSHSEWRASSFALQQSSDVEASVTVHVRFKRRASLQCR